MTEQQPVLLVLVDGGSEMPVALRYAARRARLMRGRVGLLSVVEPQEIEAWGGVERALTDEAFDLARQNMADVVALVREESGAEPVCYFRKGNKLTSLLELIDAEPAIAALVLTAQTKEKERNPLIHDLTSDKGLKKLKIPLVIIPEECRNADCA